MGYELKRVPGGRYRAKFFGEAEGKTGKWGPTVKLQWQILHDEFADEIVDVLCNKKFSAASKLREFANQLAGEIVTKFAPEDYVGVEGWVTIEETGDFANVTEFEVDKEPSAAEKESVKSPSQDEFAESIEETVPPGPPADDIPF